MKKVIAVLSVFILAACGNGTVEKPEKLIDEDQMVDISYDFAILEALHSRAPDHRVNPNAYIQRKYKIDSLQFAQNNRYYASDIATYKKLYERVEERIKNQKSAADSLLMKSGSNSAPTTPPDADSPQIQ